MPKVVKSARGVPVDFDLLKIKAQIASAPKTTSVQAREDFVDKKFKRRLKKVARNVTQQVQVSSTVSEPPLNEESDDSVEE